jgi:hypothetical protein
MAAACLVAMPDSRAQDLLIRGARVHTLSAQGTLPDADVLVRDGRIAALGPALGVPPGTTVIEARGRPVTPGLFGGLTAIGLEEVTLERSTVDSSLSVGASALKDAQWRPEFDVALAFNPDSVLIPVARVEGLTWTVLAPVSVAGGSFVAGQGGAVVLDGRDDAIVANSRTLFINVGSDASVYSGGSRAAQFMLLEQAMREATTRLPASHQALLQPAGREVLARYLDGGRVVFRVERAADIRRIVAFAQRAGMKPVIAGAAEGLRVAHELAQANVPVLLDPLHNLPVSFDTIGARLDNAAMLHRAGVRIAFTQSEAGSHNARTIRQAAGNAVAHGLPWDAALAALTANPAEIFGIGTERGRIAVGQVADLVIWTGDPLEVTTVAEDVIVAGRPIEVRSRQTELRERYLPRLRNRAAR